MSVPKDLGAAAMAAALTMAIVSAAPASAADEEKPPAGQLQGTDLGGKAMMFYVARDKAQWEAVKKAAGARQMLPRGARLGDPLEKLDDTDFDRQMIVAVFWGEMSFSGQNEKCWIENVAVEDDQLVVHCRANLWGGAVKHAYRAWPYEVRVVPRGELPVTLVQTTIYQAAPKQSQQDKLLTTLKPGEWKKEIKRGE